jgi:hypothetical protein
MHHAMCRLLQRAACPLTSPFTAVAITSTQVCHTASLLHSTLCISHTHTAPGRNQPRLLDTLPARLATPAVAVFKTGLRNRRHQGQSRKPPIQKAYSSPLGRHASHPFTSNTCIMHMYACVAHTTCHVTACKWLQRSATLRCIALKQPPGNGPHNCKQQQPPHHLFPP